VSDTSRYSRFFFVDSILWALVLLLLATYAAHAQDAGFHNTLMPQPATLTVGSGSLPITSALSLTLNGGKNPLLLDAAARMLRRLEAETAVPLQKNLQAANAVIDVKVEDASATRPAFGIDESYTLDSDSSRVLIHAKTIFGAIYAFETLLQLVEPQGDDFVIPAVHIADAPRFPWRGLLLDPGRHFLSVDEILRTLDGMAAVKLNVLHWHLTEDQGFRIESLRYPKLHQLGSEGQYYTQQQVREIVRYAAARGIRVMPEFDIPGHSTTWFIGYPELASQPGPYEVSHANGVHDAAMNPAREETYRFLDNFFGEMTALFPDEFIHIGGDESNGKHWMANPEIVRFMKEHNLPDTKALQAYFNHRVEPLLKKHNRQMVGWDEILHADLSPDVVVQNWHGIEFLIDGARQGHRGLLSQPFYLDHAYSAGQMYAADPLPAGAGLSDAEAKLILGGEACMWGELVSNENIDSRIWPRSAAVAERFWSPVATRDVEDMYRRLAVMSLRLDALGVTHLSGPQRGLRQIAGSLEGASALEQLQAVLQPVDFHPRQLLQHTSALTPLVRFVDYAQFDPLMQDHLRVLVEEYLHGANATQHTTAGQQLRSIFESWIAVAPALEQLVRNRPLMHEMRTRCEQLPQLGRLGMEAIDDIEAHRVPQPASVKDGQALLAQSEQSSGFTDFVVLPQLKTLVDAAEKP
jgi:hexosaminidase